MARKDKTNDPQPLLPAAQAELDQKLQQLTFMAGGAHALEAAELALRGMRMQVVRAVVDNSEIVKLKGFNRLEDYLASFGIKARIGFYLKKIAEAFSDEEIAMLQSMGFSQRGVLRLANIPAEQRPRIGKNADPEELKEQIENLLSDIETKSKAHEKELRKKDSLIEGLKGSQDALMKKLEEYKDLIPDSLADTKARQRVQIIKGLHVALIKAVRGIDLGEMTIEDPHAANDFTGTVKTMYNDVLEIAHMIEEFEAGRWKRKS